MLTYRGVSYEYQPTGLTTSPTGDVGKYRGQDIQFRAVDNPPPVYPFKAELVYRGVAYTVGATAPKAVPDAAAAKTAPVELPSINAWMRSLVVKHLRNIRRREHSMLVRAAEEIGLPAEDAAGYESHIQGKVPHDFAGYDRSRSAMS
ncbi:DUF4278 domain-containing protein [Leptolyngbya cf. ectocarpi LEGE 11479]|uniref:DUF4278 domain-containing protein n=1 Tax=Leptolyngbya cf. ectocarpi LEGE 11479 TaxID=1828722 RepID=A0A929FCB3_LEPEC|nr:DUF4278 domain-containing protein [Leptolyngbya ectocarpi]MBE9069877.1 DUF4278 domain-containing protein [Leptolyngbya cf. ectocarpi LEGE 11479]